MKKSDKVESLLFKGPTRNFKIRNPEGHADKWKWFTLKEGMKIPKEVLPQIKEEQKKEDERKAEEILSNRPQTVRTKSSKSSCNENTNRPNYGTSSW